MNLLQENYYQNLLSDLEGYSRLVSSDVVRIICERLKKVGELNPTSVRQIITMTKEMDIDMRAIKKAIAKRMGMTLKEVDRVFDQAAMDSAELAMALAKDQVGIVNMKGIKKLARATANKCKEMILNLSDTFGFKLGKQNLSIRNAYIAVVNKATLAVQTGALDYDTAIREEVKRLSDAGISVVQWESGYRRRLDSSIRMNVMEGVRQMNQEVLNEAGEKFADGVEISAHDRPAPDHADIQGKQFTKEEYEKLNASLKRPIGTLNCMHIAFPIIYGVTEPSYTDEELRTMKENANKKYSWKGKELNGYECTQKQREYETEIRKAQDREKALRAAGDKEGADREHKRAVDLRKEHKAFSEHVGLKEKLNRTGRSGTPGKPNVQKKIGGLVIGEQQQIAGIPQKQLTARYWDVTEEYDKSAKPNEGDWFTETGYREGDDHEQLISTAETVLKKYGGDIEFLAEDSDEGEPNPDWLWRGKLWDVKCPTSMNAIKQRLGTGVYQIKDNPGGVILNLYDFDISQHDIWRAINGRMKQTHCKYDVDIMVIQKGEVTLFLRYTKNR